MYQKKYIIFAGLFVCSIFLLSCGSEKMKIELVEKDDAQKVDVLVDGKLFTSYIYPSTIKKPVLWPVVSPGGNTLTRCFPLAKKEGEQVDHPHHVGIWLNYGDVDGYDFWNNSDAILEERRGEYGTIVHRSIDKVESGRGKAVLEISADWDIPDGSTLLKEKARFDFIAENNLRIIDRETKLTALSKDVLFKDNKEGVFAIRVTRELEMPSNKPLTLIDSHGVATVVENPDNANVSGSYLSNDGLKDGDVWGTRGRWVRLSGKINNEEVSIVIIDHPNNVGYPTYWHARGYGLFAANPWGQAIFSKGKEILNYKLEKGTSFTIKFRMVVSSEELSADEINKLADDFAKK